MKQIGDGREHVPVWLIAQDQPVIRIEQNQPFGNTGDGGGQFGFRQIHALLGLDGGSQIARRAAIAGEDTGVGEKRRAADADGAQGTRDIAEAAGQTAERPVPIQITKPLGFGIGANQFP